MLDEICPVQFVGGLNEGAKPLDEDPIVITRYEGIGIQYVPEVNYILTRLEIALVFGEDCLMESQITLNFCADYDDKPSDIVLASGSFAPKPSYQGWCEVKLKPTSMIRNRKYWITIHDKGMFSGLVRAEKGKGCVLSIKQKETRWKAPPDKIKDGKVMFRFYGRILAINS